MEQYNTIDTTNTSLSRARDLVNSLKDLNNKLEELSKHEPEHKTNHKNNTEEQNEAE